MKPDLDRLRDIHLPAPISWWPPAPGWWILAVLLLAILFIGYRLIRRRGRNGWRRQALQQLMQLRGSDDSTLVTQLSALLRRVAISRFPQAEVAAITGEAWLVFLDRTLGEGTPFQAGAGRALLSAPYVAAPEVDGPALLALAERWIKRVGGPSR